MVGDIAHREAGLSCDEGRHAGRVEHSCLAKHPIPRPATALEGAIGQGVHRVGDHEDHGVRGVALGLVHHLVDDSYIGLKHVRAGHARLARQAGRYDQHVRATHDLRVVAAAEFAIELEEGGGLTDVQGDALRHVLADVVEGNLPAQLLFGKDLGRGLPDSAGTDDGDLAHLASSVEWLMWWRRMGTCRLMVQRSAAADRFVPRPVVGAYPPRSSWLGRGSRRHSG